MGAESKNYGTDMKKECPICGGEILIDIEATRALEIIKMLGWYLLEIDKRRMIIKWKSKLN